VEVERVETQAFLGYLFLPKKVTEKGNLKIELLVGQ
jgi:hypothetical protein